MNRCTQVKSLLKSGGAQMRSLVVLVFSFVPAGGFKTQVSLLLKRQAWVFICLAWCTIKDNFYPLSSLSSVIVACFSTPPIEPVE
jgi:hypothetical protein